MPNVGQYLLQKMKKKHYSRGPNPITITTPYLSTYNVLSKVLWEQPHMRKLSKSICLQQAVFHTLYVPQS